MAEVMVFPVYGLIDLAGKRIGFGDFQHLDIPFRFHIVA